MKIAKYTFFLYVFIYLSLHLFIYLFICLFTWFYLFILIVYLVICYLFIFIFTRSKKLQAKSQKRCLLFQSVLTVSGSLTQIQPPEEYNIYKLHILIIHGCKLITYFLLYEKRKSICLVQCYSSNSPNLLKAQATLSDTTARRSTVEPGDLKPCWISDKKTAFFE